MGQTEIFWLIALIFFLIVEAATPTLVSVWFALGSLAALVISCIGVNFPLQLLVFFVVSAVALFVTRPLAKKYLDNKQVPTNADMAIGKKAVVTEEISNLNSQGAVFCLGKVWSARSADGKTIEKDTQVIIQAIEGVKLIVIPADDSAKEI